MTSPRQSRETEYGTIYFGGTCKDDYENIARYDQPKVPDSWPTVVLQLPAIRALQEAERKYARRTRPWKRKRPIRLTGSWRSCEFQRECWERDPERYAHPDSGVHTRGLAIDVHTGILNDTVRRCLLGAGWTQSRPDDEPWHFSYSVTA